MTDVIRNKVRDPALRHPPASYLYPVNHPLNNPVFNSLSSGDQHLGFGNKKVKAFHEEVSPFAGFEEGYTQGFNDLYDLLPNGRYILYATPQHIDVPTYWKLIQKVEGVQMILDNITQRKNPSVELVRLNTSHIEEMVQLAKLTKPGPFNTRTIEFGHYFGVVENKRLVAMAGQRMHVQQFTEVSAVCTHPDHLGKGYASALVHHQVNLILQLNQTPFLHVRGDNYNAIRLYERLGFQISRPMNFYFMKKRNEKS